MVGKPTDPPEKKPDKHIGFPLTESDPKTLVVHCGDPRFQNAFYRFITGPVEGGGLGLKPGEFVSLIIPGGIASLTNAVIMPKQHNVHKKEIVFYAQHFENIQTVVLINHEDCGTYRHLLGLFKSQFMKNVTDIPTKQRQDLLRISKEILAMPELKKKPEFKVYMANFSDEAHKNVVFQEITAK